MFIYKRWVKIKEKAIYIWLQRKLMDKYVTLLVYKKIGVKGKMEKVFVKRHDQCKNGIRIYAQS